MKSQDLYKNRVAKGAPKLPNNPIRFVIHFLRFYPLGLFFIFLLEAGQAGSHLMVPYAIREIMDGVVGLGDGADSERAYEALKNPVLLFIMFNLGILFFSRASGYTLMLVAPALRRRIRATVYRYLQFHSARYFLNNFAGSLSNRINEVAMSTGHVLWTVVFDFWPIAIVLSVSLVLLSLTHVGLALFVGGWAAAFIGIAFLLAKKARHYSQQFAAARSVTTGKIVDGVTNILNSKLFALMGHERRHLKKYLDDEFFEARKMFWFMEKVRWFQFTAALILMVGTLLYGLDIWLAGGMSVGTFAMVNTLSLMIVGEARNVSRRFLEFFEYVGNISDGVEIIVKPHEVIDERGAPELTLTTGKIEFKDLGFTYAKGVKVFNKLNVTIQPGEKVGLVGFSGSGKTTFMNLLLRLYEAQQGEILLDGQNILKVTQNSLRRQVSMIPQDPILFHRSLMENIRYGKINASDEEVIEASKKAYVHEFVEQLPHKYEALVGERGVKLSGGQRQRIAIARAMLKQAPMLLMDEATSSLDSVTEKHIQNSLKSLIENKTVVVIAHRLSTISHLDRILVFHEGKIVEDGSHDALIRSGGHYARLWEMQAGGFLPESAPETDDQAGVSSESAGVGLPSLSN